MTRPADLLTVFAAIDRANADDPRLEIVDGEPQPRELVYARRMSECLSRLYPDASDELRIAARAQHIRRWEIARATYPDGRQGYNAWRAACREHHARLITAILADLGFGPDVIAPVTKYIRKQELKSDPGSQALEDVVGVVFVESYMAEFATAHPDYDEDKLVGILRKTLRKMGPVGHAGVNALPLPPAFRDLVDRAMV